ncbi:rubredoxin-like domain-containing protein [Clostridium sp. UBA1056]|uniref:rubredoxin-like domain-containing protein n=1 Tax=unclassified Clostridium TaxID=2614128 RepID=UPI0032179AAF
MKKYICKVCGYIYEGEELPKDFICPICGVGVEMFEELKENNLFSNFKVFNKVKENDVVTSFYLTPVNKKALKTHKAGQFISIKPISTGDKSSEVRQYTLSMKPGEDFYRISVKREDKGLISRYLHDNINISDEVEITEPLGEFILKDSNKPLVLISGGIGITPMMSMLYKAIEEGRKVKFIQAVLNSNVHTFKKDLKDLAEKYDNIDVEFFYSNPLDTDKLGEDYQVEGYLTKEWIEHNLSKDEEFYFCGPLGFMKMIYDALKSMGVSDDSINYEMFGPSADLAKM